MGLHPVAINIMASTPPPKNSKRQHLGKAVRRTYDRLKDAIKPSSRLSSQNPGSTAAPSTGAMPSSSALPAISTQSTATQHVLLQGAGTTNHIQSAGPSATGVGSTLTATQTAPVSTPKPTTADKLRIGASTGLEAALRVLEKSAETFPPLKSAVGQFLSCLDIIKASYGW